MNGNALNVESEDKNMKKLFISQPMKGKSDEEILRERKRAIQCACRILSKKWMEMTSEE